MTIASSAQAELALGGLWQFPDDDAGHAINDIIDCIVLSKTISVNLSESGRAFEQ
jgi:hypothetical protein